MEELKIGGQIRIVCEDGNTNSAKIYANGNLLETVKNIDIELLPNSLVKAKLVVSSLKIDTKAALTEVKKSYSQADEVKKIIDRLPEPDKWVKNKQDKAYEAIFDIINIFYPEGNREYPED